ncbi:glycoside hydrolase superfamily [Emericellopsis atlantica]|uniref:non-reducing end alpha-L-arabinofuranosidase n=1 Tax=Emericellopsis atlantica TaxID=2614577 RepID=A0A9P7ZJ76_9HYPO|nr:glycoside hydrolase superfamily [Emericellopsis atlantica]KAG9252711.1 glycoside hydrolase superfamily [Emericellopsis atlantica]
MRFLAALPLLCKLASSLRLDIAPNGGNASSPLLYGLLYEEIYHSGDGGLYGEMIRNRAFQGSPGPGRRASFDRNTEFWHPIGDVELSIDTTAPALSDSLTYQMRMDVPEGTTGPVGFYNDGFWGFHVDAAKRYAASFYLRGDYDGDVECFFTNTLTGEKLSSATTRASQDASQDWVQHKLPTFQPQSSASTSNNTFSFVFDGSQLAGQSVYVNLLSLFKQTYQNRDNGLREDLAQTLADLKASWIRLPGGNNMEGLSLGNQFKWNESIGSLEQRFGKLSTWGDIETQGFGLLEQMTMARDMNLTVVLGIYGGLSLNGDVVPEDELQPYVDSAMDELEFLTGDASTPMGAKRVQLGYEEPFQVDWVEISNEDYLNGGYDSYYAYRFDMFYNAIRAKYPDMHVVSTINPSPSPDTGSGAMVDLHIYDNQNHFASLYNTFDQASRKYPVFVGEYAAIREGSGAGPEIGAQTFGMACGEAIMLLGIEKNSDIILGSAYGALIKEYNEEPNTVAVIKHTANEILHSMSYYLQQLFAAHVGTETLPVTATEGGLGPVWWSATKAGRRTVLKMVNYNGATGAENAVKVHVKGSRACTAELTVFTADKETSSNKLPSQGGDEHSITTRRITGKRGVFEVAFTKPFEIVILTV